MATPIPLVVVIAGPNGAGKTTASSSLLLGAMAVDEFVNADAIAVGLSAFRPEQVAITAGRIMLDRLQSLARSRRSFAFETTLASRSFAPWLRGLREDGYRVHLAFLSLPSVDLAIARVRERVRRGGHDIPELVVRRRYIAGLQNFFGLYQEIADDWQLLDNSDVRAARLVAKGGAGLASEIADVNRWTALTERANER